MTTFDFQTEEKQICAEESWHSDIPIIRALETNSIQFELIIIIIMRLLVTPICSSAVNCILARILCISRYSFIQLPFVFI